MIARLIHPAECLCSVIQGVMVADCAIDLIGVNSAGTGCANGTKNKTRRLKSLLHKQSPPARTQEGVLKPDFGIKSHINGLGFRFLTND